MLDDLLLGEHGLVPYGLERATHALMGRFGNTLVVNGETSYELDVSRNQVVRFFFTNASNTRTFNLSFGDLPMKLVGTDVGNYEREAWVENVIIAPAERYIVHVRFPDSGVVPLINAVQGIDHIGGRFFPEVDTLGVVRVAAADARPDLRGDFEALLRRLLRFYRTTPAAALLAGLIAESQSDPAVAEAFQRQIVDQRRPLLTGPLERARERGEIGADFDMAFAADLFTAAVWHRLLLGGKRPEKRFVAGLLDSLMGDGR